MRLLSPRHKPVIAVLASAALVFSFLRPAPSAVQLPPEEVAAYGLDEGSGPTATDASGNSNHGTIVGATWTTQGRYGSALGFDGNNDRVSGPTITLGGAFTLMAWINNPSNAAIETILTVGSTRDVYLSNGVLTLYTGNNEFRFGAPVPTSSWQHVAVTYQSGTVAAYVNGAARGTIASGSLGSATGRLQVGAWASGTENWDFFGGVVDEVRVYDRALTAGEIQTAMSTPIGGAQPDTTAPMRSNGQPSGTLPSGTQSAQISLATDESATCRYAVTAGTSYGSMSGTFATMGGTTHSTQVSGLADGTSYTYYVRCQDTSGNANTTDFIIAFSIASPSAQPSDEIAAYGLDEGSGPTATDASGNSNHGTIVGATWTTQGRYGSALGFDGNNDRVSGPTITLGGAFTLMAWINNPSNAAIETILTVGSTRDVYLSNGVLTLYTGNNEFRFGAPVPTSSWQHVAVTYQSGTVAAYVNGAARGTIASGSLGSATGRLQVGAWASGTENWDFFGGVVDEVRVYDRALTAGEIQTAMSTPIGGAQPDTTAPMRSNGQPSGTLPSGTQSAQISLATDESATCRYSVTAGTAYGAMSGTFTTTGGTTHSRQVSGLVDGTSYTYYVRCQDTSGNANSTDFAITFTVSSQPDTTPPAVAVTSPTQGAGVSGVINVTANASDNRGVVGVQFLLDGANLGAEDLAAPYSVSWNTAAASSGSHSLRAVARDAAGNSTTSAAVAVTVNNSSGEGFALRFYGTRGTQGVDLVRARIGNPQTIADVGGQDFTIEWWMRCSNGANTQGSISPGASYDWISGNIVFDRDLLGGPSFGDFGMALGGERLVFGVENAGGSRRTIVGSTDVCTNAWIHVAFMRSRATGDLAIYVDGRRDAFFAGGPGGDISYNDSRPTPATWDPYFALGGEKHALNVAGYNGFIDELRISNSLRYTGTTYTVPSAAFSADGNTVALYHMDEGSGTVMNDETGPTDATLYRGGPNNGPTWVVSDAPFVNNLSVQSGNPPR